jgi:cytoskeletal protein RodZ
MSAPTLDRHPGSSQAGSSEGRRRRRTLVLVASALIVLALAVGTSLAIATRPVARQAPASATPAAAAEDQNANTDQGQTETETQGQDATGTATGTGSGSQGSGAGTAAPVLPDGETTAYITKVASGRIVVDVVQVFHDDQAVKAAIADGTSPSDAKYLTTWVRNENPRLRTLPLAGDLEVKLRDACGEPGNSREAQLTRLAANAALRGTYYYTLSVSDGTVERIEERLAVNAC